jgi:hypothetical protein
MKRREGDEGEAVWMGRIVVQEGMRRLYREHGGSGKKARRSEKEMCER